MCLGYAVRMARCGHWLCHYRDRCGRGCWESCEDCQQAEECRKSSTCGECRKEKTGQPCQNCKKGRNGGRCEKTKPSGPEYELDDYCSRCDPDCLLYHFKFFYEDRKEKWEEQRREGEPDHELDETLSLLKSKYLEERQKILDRDPNPPRGVPFLPCVDMTQLGLNSQQVDKYLCVWDDPPDEARKIRRVEGCYPDDDDDFGYSTDSSEDSTWVETPPEDSRSLFDESEEDDVGEEVDWLAIADLQIKNDHDRTARSRLEGPWRMTGLDRLPSLLPPEMEMDSFNIVNQRRRRPQVTISPSKLQPHIPDSKPKDNLRR
ncbi:putative RING-type domain-containing protein [Seiridium cardinale]